MEKKKDTQRIISEERIAKAVEEVDAAILAKFPDDREYPHEFSPEFEAKMAELIESIN